MEAIFGGDFAADHGSVANAADFASITGLPTGGSLTIVDGRTLKWGWASGQNLAADTSISFDIPGKADINSQAFMNPDFKEGGPDDTDIYPVTINLIDTSGDVVDTLTVYFQMSEAVNIRAIVPEFLKFQWSGGTEPSGGKIYTTSSVTMIDFGTLADGTPKQAILDLKVDIVGDASLTGVADPSNTIAAVSGTNASPAAWPTLYLLFDNDKPVEGSTATSQNDAEGWHQITINVEVDTRHPAGTYHGTISFIVVPKF